MCMCVCFLFYLCVYLLIVFLLLRDHTFCEPLHLVSHALLCPQRPAPRPRLLVGLGGWSASVLLSPKFSASLGSGLLNAQTPPAQPGPAHAARAPPPRPRPRPPPTRAGTHAGAAWRRWTLRAGWRRDRCSCRNAGRSRWRRGAWSGCAPSAPSGPRPRRCSACGDAGQGAGCDLAGRRARPCTVRLPKPPETPETDTRAHTHARPYAPSSSSPRAHTQPPGQGSRATAADAPLQALLPAPHPPPILDSPVSRDAWTPLAPMI